MAIDPHERTHVEEVYEFGLRILTMDSAEDTCYLDDLAV